MAYGVLASIAVLVSIPILLLLLIPATPALAIFYLLNRKLSHSLVDVLKVSNGLYKNEHQGIEVSFREVNAGDSDIKWDMEVKFPPQFEHLLRDLYEDKDGSWFNVARDSERNTILKLLANIHLKNGLVPLHDEIKNVLATSIREFAKTMEELMKLEKKDITYDKLKELLNKFRLKVVNSVDPKLTSHLIQDAYRVAFIQAIKFAQGERKKRGDFSLEKRLKEVLVEQELKSQCKELPTEKEIIIKDLKELKRKEALDLADEDDRLEALAEVGNITNDISDKEFPVLKAVWEQLIKEEKIAKRTIIDDYRNMYPKETAEALHKAEVMIKELKGMEEKRYEEICEELRKIHGDIGKNNLKDGALKRKLEDLFGFKGNDQEVEQRLIKSLMRRTKIILSQSDIADKEKQSLMKQLENLEKEAPGKVNDFIAKMYLEITKCRIQGLFEKQAKGIERSCKLLEKDAPDLVEKINSHRTRFEKYLRQPEQHALLKRIIEGNKDLNKYLEDERNSKGKEHPNTKLIEQHLENNQEILKALEDLESEKEGLLINEETKNDYREELTSRERIKFAIIEDKLLGIIKASSEDEMLKKMEEASNKGELLEIKETSKDKLLEIIRQVAIEKLLEKAELEYCLAERCIKYPVIKAKDNIKHFCHALLSPLIGNLVEKIINHVPKNGKSPWLQPRKSLWTAYGYIKTGLDTTIWGDKSIEGKALKVAHDTYEEVKEFLKYLESSYEEVVGLIGDVFSDGGEKFKKDIWPKIRDNLYEVWYRFFKDIEFNIGNRLDEVNVTQQKQETVIAA